MIDATQSAEEIARRLRERYEGDYAAFHAPRYAFLLKMVAGLVVDGRRRTALDIGTSIFTNALREAFDLRVDTLDLPRAGEGGRGFVSAAEGETRHIPFDLNELEDRSRWPEGVGPYDLVLLCEVLEHLRISPHHVFAFLRAIVAPGGALVVQTPNAAAINKRVKLLAGRNPYEPLRDDPSDPGHFREYTAAELRRYARSVGFRVADLRCESYFDCRYRERRAGARLGAADSLRNVVFRGVPSSWCLGITAVLEPAGRGD